MLHYVKVLIKVLRWWSISASCSCCSISATMTTALILKNTEKKLILSKN